MKALPGEKIVKTRCVCSCVKYTRRERNQVAFSLPAYKVDVVALPLGGITVRASDS